MFQKVNVLSNHSLGLSVFMQKLRSIDNANISERHAGKTVKYSNVLFQKN